MATSVCVTKLEKLIILPVQTHSHVTVSDIKLLWALRLRSPTTGTPTSL